MKFEIKKTKEKEPATYKSIYIKESLAQEVELIAKENNTSFNKFLSKNVF